MTVLKWRKKALETFYATWDSKYPSISQSWKNNWANIIPFFAYPPEIRKVVYTTNAIESLNMTIRKILKTRASFPNDDALRKLLFLGLQNASKKWTMPIRDWVSAVNQFLILYGDRVALRKYQKAIYTKYLIPSRETTIC